MDSEAQEACMSLENLTAELAKHQETIKALEAEIAALKEQLRWRNTDEEPPPCGENVLVWWSDDVDIEIDYTDVEVDYGTEYFVNAGDMQPIKWAPINHPEVPCDQTT